MKNYRSLEAYNFFQSGWVHDVLHVISLTGVFIFKAKVMRSQRVTEKPHSAWVAADREGIILAAHCTCMAGYVVVHFIDCLRIPRCLLLHFAILYCLLFI